MTGTVLNRNLLPNKEVEVSESVIILNVLWKNTRWKEFYIPFFQSTQSQLVRFMERDTSHVSTNCYYEMRD